MTAPPHIPDDVIIDFDFLRPAGLEEEGDIYLALKRLHQGPDIVWTPNYGGHWLVTRCDDARFVQENYQVFSHEEFLIPRRSPPIMTPPLTVDPPDHARYRAVLNPFFRSSAVRRMREEAEALTISLIEEFLPRGHCEFVNEFARVMPVTMFLRIVDLPLERREEFVDWGLTYMSSVDKPEVRMEAHRRVSTYLTEVLEQRYREPGDDLLSAISGWRDNSRYEGPHELIGMALLMFFGGLDTVANLFSFVMRELAESVHLRERLRNSPEIVPQAAEEFIRRFGLSNTGRLVKQDFEYKGITFKAGEMVMVSNPLASIDERAFEDPLRVDFDRGTAAHNTFGNGPHRCVGQGLARAELEVLLTQWLKHIPDFRLDPARPPVTHSGHVIGIDHLHLVWGQ